MTDISATDILEAAARDGLSREECIEVAESLIRIGAELLRELSQCNKLSPAPTGGKAPELLELGRVAASWGVMGQ